jgi:cyclic GMP-AMP synthase DncV-like protein
MHDCHKEMKAFHAQEVTLPNKEQKSMRERRDNGRIRLENGLRENEKPLPKEFSSQGSYTMRTMVQDPENDYDIDDGVYFNKDDLVNSNGEFLSPRGARIRIKNALKDERLAYDAVVKTNCVRQDYPTGYHIDIPVYRVSQQESIWGELETIYEHASGDEWTESDARGVTKWFKSAVGDELKTGEADTSQLRRVTKLTKKFARSRNKWKSKTTSGICISKLVVDHFVASSDRDDEALRKTWEEIAWNLEFDSEIKHPTQADKKLAEVGDDKVGFFADCLNDAISKFEVLDNDCSHEEACKAWDEVFDTKFFITNQSNSRSLLGTTVNVSAGLTFPDEPVVPNKPSGFA